MLRPIATTASFRSGAVGGLFTPTMSLGAILGAILGGLWLRLPLPALAQTGAPTALFALIGSGAVLAAGTQAPVSALIFMFELTHRVDDLTLPLLLAMVIATVTHRLMQPGSIYSVRE